ncbi:MAG: hypothetical protein ACXVDD_04015 [Polyangia bacterium]
MSWRVCTAALSALLVTSCGGPRDGRTGVVLVDACLHWTACVTPPAFATNLDLSDCATYGEGTHLPWRNVGVAITPAQLGCLAAAGLDCAAALACVSTPGSCSAPTWSCDGDTLTFCDAFAGPRTVTEDCAAEGLHCITVGDEARCGLDNCDPLTATPTCAGSRVTSCVAQTSYADKPLGGLLVAGDDCRAHDAVCSNGQCVGNGPACAPSADTLGCDGNDVVFCDQSGHQERNVCGDGLHCAANTTGPGFSYVCVGSSGKLVTCLVDANFQQCDGTKLEYCDDHGNEQLDCLALGYSGCDSGHCVP